MPRVANESSNARTALFAAYMRRHALRRLEPKSKDASARKHKERAAPYTLDVASELFMSDDIPRRSEETVSLLGSQYSDTSSDGSRSGPSTPLQPWADLFADHRGVTINSPSHYPCSVALSRGRFIGGFPHETGFPATPLIFTKQPDGTSPHSASSPDSFTTNIALEGLPKVPTMFKYRDLHELCGFPRLLPDSAVDELFEMFINEEACGDYEYEL